MRAILAALAAGILAALLPPGTPGGTPARVRCTVWRPDAGLYIRMAGPGALLPDGGIVLPDYPDAVVIPRDDLCKAAVVDGGVAFTGVTPECACSSGANCQALTFNSDGGSAMAAAPIGVTLSAGAFDGGGCIPKICGVLAGWPEGWPPGCPDGLEHPDAGGGGYRMGQ